MELKWFQNVTPMIAIVGLLGLSGLGLTGCDLDDGGSTDLSEARDFAGYLLYYAGPNVGGESLSDVVGPAEQGPGKGWTFIYGDCTPGGDEGGCPLPVDVQNYPICRRWPEAYPWKVPLYDFRGAKATRRAGGEIEIYTGRTTIVIFTAGVSPSAVARQLRIVGQQQRATRFPPPVKGSLQGNLPCQTKPG